MQFKLNTFLFRFSDFIRYNRMASHVITAVRHLFDPLAHGHFRLWDSEFWSIEIKFVIIMGRMCMS